MPLSLMLTDVAEGALAATRRRGLRATRVEMTLPVDLGVKRDRGSPDVELLGELPRFVTRTDFDPAPSRLTIVWEEGPP
jgi:hypothetical protein